MAAEGCQWGWHRSPPLGLYWGSACRFPVGAPRGHPTPPSMPEMGNCSLGAEARGTHSFLPAFSLSVKPLSTR